jgi:hypothetical protein
MQGYIMARDKQLLLWRCGRRPDGLQPVELSHFTLGFYCLALLAIQPSQPEVRLRSQ